MKTDEMILEELEQLPNVTIAYIQRKYQRSFIGARKLQHKWVENEPKDPTFEEKLQKWEENSHDLKMKPIKKRFTAFRINGKFFNTWPEAQKEIAKK